jgi:transposase
MVLLAAEGLRNDEIAARLDCGRDVVSQRCKRFFEQRLAGLEDRPRRSRPPVFPPEGRAEVIAMACALPAEHGVPLSRWSASELAREAMTRGICEQISGVTVWRWPSQDAIKPWQHRSWIFPRDPLFAEKAGPILDLYAGVWQGERLHPGDYVICADEKPSIQARHRKTSTRPARPGEGQKVEHEYERKGALCYLAAWDARRAKILTAAPPRTASSPSTR